MYSASMSSAASTSSTQMIMRAMQAARQSQSQEEEGVRGRRTDGSESGQTASTVSDFGTGGLLSSDALGSLLQGQGGASGMGGGMGGGFEPPAFDDIDTDGDGSITQSEMQTFGQSVHGDTDTTKSDELFASMDTDGDGSITADEKTSFDDQRAASRPSGPGGPPPSGPPPSASEASATESETTTDGTQTSAQLAELMEQLMKAYSAQSKSSTDTAQATTSVAA